MRGCDDLRSPNLSLAVARRMPARFRSKTDTIGTLAVAQLSTADITQRFPFRQCHRGVIAQFRPATTIRTAMPSRVGTVFFAKGTRHYNSMRPKPPSAGSVPTGAN